jgi:hypothetical protein
MIYDIKDMYEIARFHGGKCLSKEYINQYVPLKWMCKKGHTWNIGFYQINQGYWCVQCLKEEEKEQRFEEIKLHVQKFGIECISKKYIRSRQKLKWRCLRNHTWEEKYSNLYIRKVRCFQCKTEDRLAAELKKLKTIAVKRGGKCLSAYYLNNKKKLTWQCSKGHVWEAVAHNVVDRHSWCPVCAGKAKHTIEEMKQLAKAKGGKCLSSKYKNNLSKLKWQCNKGHIWKAIPFTILSGGWCIICGYARTAQKQRAPISEVRKTARKRGGKLLSETYLNSRQSLQWQCSKGHVWEARYTDVNYKHSWCPVCARERRFKINRA